VESDTVTADAEKDELQISTALLHPGREDVLQHCASRA
jgi:hypothetical protein